MKNKELYKKLSEFGLPLFEVEESVDARSMLVQIVQSSDLRLWEGFAVVLANLNQQKLFKYSEVQGMLKKKEDKEKFKLLVLLSLALYQLLGLRFSWMQSLKAEVKGEKQFKNFFQNLKKGTECTIGEKKLSLERFKTIFTNYYQSQHKQLQNLSVSKAEFNLEYALSQIFSPKQKELFLKKFRAEPFSKTEKEYYSRTVKKKVLALSNPELHKMAQQLIV